MIQYEILFNNMIIADSVTMSNVSNVSYWAASWQNQQNGEDWDRCPHEESLGP